MEAYSHIVLFDGYCNLCNGAVQLMIKNERKDTFKFASIQSKFAKQLLITAPKKIQQSDSIIYYKKGSFYYKSSAALLIALELKFPYPLFIFFWIVPYFIRDFFYEIIAKYRYQWFGKKEACMVPSPQLKSKFISDEQY